MDKLYVQIPIPDTLKEFILSAFNFRSGTEDRLVYDEDEDGVEDDENEYFFATTYNDPSFDKVDCYCGRRSFYDLLRVSQTYFPKTTKEELGQLLGELINNDELHWLYCGDIHKFVFYRATYYNDPFELDHYNMIVTDPADNLYPKEFQKLLNLQYF